MQYPIWAGIISDDNQILTECVTPIEATKITDAINDAMRQMANQHPGCKIRIIEAKLQSSKRCEDIDEYTDLQCV